MRRWWSNLALRSAAVLSVGSEPGIDTLFHADFSDETYTLNDEASDFSTMFPGFARTGAALGDDDTGAWASYAEDVARNSDDWLMLEAAGTNGIRNSNGSGASSPSTLPTNWSSFQGSGVTRTVVGSGTEDGLPYVDIRWHTPTTANSTGSNLSFDTSTGIDALTGETWTESVFARIVGGSTTGLTYLRFMVKETTEAGATVRTEYASDNIASSLTSTRQRFDFTFTTSGGGTVAHVMPRFEVTYDNGASFDITIRFYVPQMEEASVASSPVVTTSAAVTRNADDLDIALPALGGTHDLVFTHDDLSTTVIADVAGGLYTLDPANLDRPRVTAIDWGSV